MGEALRRTAYSPNIKERLVAESRRGARKTAARANGAEIF